MTIAEIRKEKRIYQREVAEYLGLARATYCKYERNPMMFTAEQLHKMAELFEVPSAEIFLATKSS